MKLTSQKLIVVVFSGMFCFSMAPARAQNVVDRTVLPIAEPAPPTYDELDARDAKAPPRFEVRAPRGHPTW